MKNIIFLSYKNRMLFPNWCCLDAKNEVSDSVIQTIRKLENLTKKFLYTWNIFITYSQLWRSNDTEITKNYHVYNPRKFQLSQGVTPYVLKNALVSEHWTALNLSQWQNCCHYRVSVIIVTVSLPILMRLWSTLQSHEKIWF